MNLTTTTIATFEYDGAGRRTEKVAAGLTHQYIYDAEDIVEERISGSSSDTIRYYHGAGIDEPLARKNSSDVVTYYMADHLGSIVQEANASGVVAIEREYDPWGELLAGATVSGYAFQGREWDAEVSLFYFRARYFNARTGSWVTDDPIGFAGGSNFSRFVNNNPTRFVDPFGLCGDEQKPAATIGRFKSAREAGKAAVESINQRSIKEDVEYGGMIYRNKRDDSYDYTEPERGQWHGYTANVASLSSDQELAGLYHTHGANSIWDKLLNTRDWQTSPGDKLAAHSRDVPMYIGTSWYDAVKEYDPKTGKEITIAYRK